MIKIDGNKKRGKRETLVPHTIIEGDLEILRYLDISGYLFKKEPFNRSKND